MKNSADSRKLVEDIIVTPFFKRHAKHKPISIKLHAEITEDDDFVTLETEIPGYNEDLLDVSASSSTIDVHLHSETEGPRDVEKSADEISFYNSYTTPSKIDPDSLEVSHEGDKLIVRAKKLEE